MIISVNFKISYLNGLVLSAIGFVLYFIFIVSVPLIFIGKLNENRVVESGNIEPIDILSGHFGIYLFIITSDIIFRRKVLKKNYKRFLLNLLYFELKI